MARLGEILRNPFAFLFTRSQKEELMAEYVIREHHRGRPLADILDDPHIRNNCTQAQIHRLLDNPEVLQAIGRDVVASQRSQV